MTRTTRITEQLNWSSYKETYFIGSRNVEELVRDSNGNIVIENNQPKVAKVSKFVNELQEAIDAGVFDTLVQECAAKYHDGNVQAVYASMARNLDSQRHNMKERAYAPNRKIDEIRLETMVNFVNSRREAKTRTNNALPQWAYGPTEIDAIDDPAKLQKIINSINDVCCDKAHGGYNKYLGDNYVEVAKVNREYARKRKAELEAKANAVDPEIIAKLAKGSKVTLTADQAAQLMKLLGK
jgi:hypothetical protein